ncbi:MAG: DUF805 domain-containing protein [Campylobacter sp.]|nr:DUF805 domain-containing protein [Campylobacter sp.]
MMSFTQAVRVCLKEKFLTFSGRASRSEYWWFVLFTILVSIATGILDAILGTTITSVSAKGEVEETGIISTIITLILLIPTYAVMFRRIHDRNLSGWFVGSQFILLVLAILFAFAGAKNFTFILLFAFLGLSVYISIMTILKGDNGTNNYGPDPLNPNSNSSIF